MYIPDWQMKQQIILVKLAHLFALLQNPELFKLGQ